MNPPFDTVEARSIFLESHPPHRKIISAIRDGGWRAAAFCAMLYTLSRGRSWWYDLTHGVSTRRKIPFAKLDLKGEAALHAISYEASDPNCLRKMLLSLGIEHEKFEFVDLGAGKGRSLLVAAEFPFRRILGSELSPMLSETARRNCKAFRNRKLACQDFEVVCGDAAEFCFPKAPLVIYLFNPFGGLILSRILNNLEQSWEEQPRDVFVVYHHPVHSHLIERSRLFELFHSGMDKWDYRKLRYKVYRAEPSGERRLRNGTVRSE